MMSRGVARWLGVPALVLSALALMGFWGGSLVSRTAEGNGLFKQGKYDEALKAYTDAQLEDPENPRLQFNIGDVLFKQGKYDQAVESYRHALRAEDKAVQRDAHYNVGNSLFAKGDLPAAILSYKKALEVDPNDADAKYNLEFARAKLKEQQQQQQQKDQQQKPQQQPGQQQQQGQQQPGDQKKEQQPQQQPGQQQAQGDQEKKDQQQAAAQQEKQGPKPEQSEKQKQAQAAQRKDGQMTFQEAQAVLDALANSEKDAEQEKIRNVQGTGATTEKDW